MIYAFIAIGVVIVLAGLVIWSAIDDFKQEDEGYHK